jgi:hydrogenase maturation factor
MTALRPGKLPVDVLRELLEKYVTLEPRVVVGPGIGRDATVIDMGDRYLVAKTDPVTFATDEIGWYAVHVNANDVACCGAAPRWFLATVLLPEESTTAELADSLFAQMSSACRELEVALCGGHTEITCGLDRPIVVGQMLGEASRDRYVTSGGAQIGDALLLTKGIAIEGTAILAREQRQRLRGGLGEAELDRCAGWLRSPGISVVRDARLALETGGVHALHDPTEGGIATGLHELAEAAGVGVVVDEPSLPILTECDAVCRHLGLHPLGLIASGSLLIAADKQWAAPIVQRLEAAGIAAREIGEVTPPAEGCRLRSADGTLRPLPHFARDELARLFDRPSASTQ